MTTVEQLFRELSYGELRMQSLANDGNGTIADARQPEIIMYANEALTNLANRFSFNEKDLLLEMHPHITNYHLIKRFAKCNEPQIEPITYICDLPLEPFEDDLIKVLSVFDSLGNRIPLNDPRNALSVFTPQNKILQVPRPEEFQALSVHYQAKHKILSGLLDQPIEIPDILWPALKAYISYKVYHSIGTETALVTSSEHFQIFNNICAEVENTDATLASISMTNERFYKNGWI